MTSWPVNGNRIDSSSISVRPHRSISSQQPLIGLDECVFKLIPSAESVCVRLLAAFSDVSDGKKNVWLRPLPGPSPGGGTCQSAEIFRLLLEAKSEGISLDEHSCPALRLKDFFVRANDS